MDSAVTSTSAVMPGVVATGVASGGPTVAHANTAYVCRLGHETVQEIVTKTTELFGALRLMPAPNGLQQPLSQERQLRAKELLRQIEFLFKRLRTCYDKCNETLSAIDYMQIESCIPIKDEDCLKVEDKKSTNPKLKQLDKEHKDLEELLYLKNRQIKEIIDNLRGIVWEINTMLAMRKP